MRLVDSLKGVESYYLIISGNGTYPETEIFKALCKRFNGHEKAIFFINTPLKRQTGLAALNAIPLLREKYRIKSLIFIVDGEHIEKNSKTEIQDYLQSRGINIHETHSLGGSFQMKCKYGAHHICLYNIILGPETFIEEEVARLIEVNLGITIDVSIKKTSKGRKAIKKRVKRIIKEKSESLEGLINATSKKKLETIFPNICMVLESIEEELR